MKVLSSIIYMNKDLAGVSAVWRALHGVRGRRFYCLSCTYRLLVVCLSKSRRNGFAADDGSVSGDGRSSRCCTVGELLRDRDCVSAIAVTLVCDEKGAASTPDPARSGRSAFTISTST